jgi:hypothetical protein
MERLEKKHQESGFEDRGVRQRLGSLLRKQATAKADDLAMLVPLLPERYREHIEIVLRENLCKNARTDEVQPALARLCAEVLCEQNAQYKARRRLLRPTFDFFLELRDIELFRKAGFISESEIQEITAHRRFKKARNAVERQRRSRSKKKSPRASVT